MQSLHASFSKSKYNVVLAFPKVQGASFRANLGAKNGRENMKNPWFQVRGIVSVMLNTKMYPVEIPTLSGWSIEYVLGENEDAIVAYIPASELAPILFAEWR